MSNFVSAVGVRIEISGRLGVSSSLLSEENTECVVELEACATASEVQETADGVTEAALLGEHSRGVSATTFDQGDVAFVDIGNGVCYFVSRSSILAAKEADVNTSQRLEATYLR